MASGNAIVFLDPPSPGIAGCESQAKNPLYLRARGRDFPKGNRGFRAGRRHPSRPGPQNPTNRNRPALCLISGELCSGDESRTLTSSLRAVFV